MSFRNRLKHYLIHALNYTNKSATELISSGKLTVNGLKITENVIYNGIDEIRIGDKLLKPKIRFSYYKLYKPIGIESTFDPKRKDNLNLIFPIEGIFFVAGRLDKASEGLLLISDDGKWINNLSRPDAYKEKEYVVEVDVEITENFIEKLSAGVDIGFYTTRPCMVQKTGVSEFNIILTEGKNKQIRRMCKKLGAEVIKLKRTRIDNFYLSDLKPLEYLKFELT